MSRSLDVSLSKSYQIRYPLHCYHRDNRNHCQPGSHLLFIAAFPTLGGSFDSAYVRRSIMQEGQKPQTSSLSILATAGVEPYPVKPDEEYMNKAQLAHFKRILEAWRKQLMDEVNRTVTHMQDEAANFPDPIDRAAQEEEFSLELRNRDRERMLIKKIEKTLNKVDDVSADFGYCEDCGVEIGIPRLEARPTADLCIDCKMVAEIVEKQKAG